MTIADFLEVLDPGENIIILDSYFRTIFSGVSQNVDDEFNNYRISRIFSDHYEEIFFIQIK